MRFPPRTKLTAPPGQEPASPSTPTAREEYSPGFAIPEEPALASRWPSLVWGVVVAVIVVVVGYALLRVATGSSAEDPSLEPREVTTTGR